MKTLLLLSLAAMTAFTNPTLDEQRPMTLNDVCTAVGSGNVDQIISVVGGEVELVMPGKEDVYTATTARAELQAFFAQFEKTSYSKNHQGASKSEDAEYCIGTLNTNKGSFRVYIYVAKKGDGVNLQELHIEPN